MTSNPMTAEELRFVAETWREQGCNNYAAEFERLADLIDQPVDRREAVIDALKAFRGIVRNSADQETDPAHFADRILAALEAERPAIEAAERERLAKLAEGMANEARAKHGTLYGRNDHHWAGQETLYRRTADFIRSQGDTGQ